MKMIGGGNGWGSSFLITWAIPEGENYRALYQFSSCRSRLQDYMYTEIDPLYNYQGTEGATEIPLHKEYTCIAVKTNEVQEPLEEHLNFLHECETEAGVKHTKFHTIKSEDDTIFIFMGDPAWQSTLWKTSLYSYLLKRCVVDDDQFIDVFTQYRTEFLKNVKHNNIEYLPSKLTKQNVQSRANPWIKIHNESGFVTIAGPYLGAHNKKMHDLLVKGIKYSPKPKRVIKKKEEEENN